jgi:hypothetical protein
MMAMGRPIFPFSEAEYGTSKALLTVLSREDGLESPGIYLFRQIMMATGGVTGRFTGRQTKPGIRSIAVQAD